MSLEEINITDIVTLIVFEAIKKSERYNHFDINKILIAGSKNKPNGRRATFSKVVPLCFEGGSRRTRYNGEEYLLPKMTLDNHEILYIMYFYFPSFFDLSAREKINIIFHELHHISPQFNGDIRRHGKRKYIHGHSGKKYNESFQDEANKFYQYIMTTKFSAFLEMNTREMNKIFKKIKMKKFKKPKITKLSKSCNLQKLCP